jgi:ubiquinone/menaquinone biosynthesis C-methylase UbiE
MATSEHFDAKARQWDEHPRRQRIARTFAAELQKHLALDPTMELLEFGCGTGLVSMELRQEVASITLLDTSPGMLEVLKEKIALYGIANMQPRLGGLAAIDQSRERFDAIYSNMVLHHVADPFRTLAELAQLLKPGGALCIGDLEPEDGSFHQDELEVQQGFNPELLAAKLRDHGLQVEQCYRSQILQKSDATGKNRDYPLFFLLARRPAA